MKIAVISCIHGNMAALNAVLQDIEAHECHRTYCLGDLVGYGPFPNEVVEAIRQRQIPTVRGCWDEDIVEGLNACECSYPSLIAEKRGKLAHEWTNQQISSENRQYLAQLPLSLKVDNLCFTHGSPESNHEYLLPEMNAFIALERVLAADADILFCGHTHIPYLRHLESGQMQVKVRSLGEEGTKSASFQAAWKKIINAGSVGEPRHGRPHATYVIYDTASEQVRLREVAYNYQETCAAIVERGLPAIFAWRLARGWEYAEKAADPHHVCQR